MKSKMITKEQLAGIIDNTLVTPTAVTKEFEQFCQEAIENQFIMIAVSPCMIKYCAHELKGSGVTIGASISFPFGRATVDTKIFEIEQAIRDGAVEIEYVMNIGECKSGNFDYISDEMKAIVEICRERNVLCKVIIETCYLTDEEMVAVAKIASEIKPDFLKTSTGFGPAGARVEHVKLLVNAASPDVQIKAAGEIRDWETCAAMIDAGATRIGTRSGQKIMQEFIQQNRNS